MPRSRPVLIPIGAIGSFALVAFMVLTGCSSSKHSTATGSSSSQAPASGTTGSSPSATGSPADAATAAAVSASFVTLFNGSAPLATRLAALQSSDAFAQALASQANSPLLTQTSATVSQVALASPTVANVIYTVSLSGTPALTNRTGVAVEVGGAWKVSATTFCSLLSLQGSPPSVCTQASVTSLPS